MIMRRSPEGISKLSLSGRDLYQIGSFVLSSIPPCHQIVHSRRPILAQKPRCPTGNARTRERLGLPECATWGISSRRSRRRPAASSQAEVPSVGYLGFRARISCSQCTFCEKKQGAYRISGGYRSILIYWSSCRAGLLTQLDCSTARTPQSSKENEAQILN